MLDQTFADGAELTRAATFELEAQPDGKDDRHVRLSFSSEEPCLREFEFGTGWEILGHGPEEVDLSRLVSGLAPLLKDHRHDLDSMVGIVEQAQVHGGKGKAVVRFGQSAPASEVLARVRAGEVRGVSVGYRVHRHVRSGERDGLPVVRVTRWEPFEISFVAMPADASVGVGRSARSTGKQTHQQKERDMESQETQSRDAGSPATLTAERNRVAEITAIGRRFELPTEDVDAAIADGTSAERFRRVTLDYIGERSSSEPTRSIATMAGLRRAQERPYSLTRVVNAAMTGDWREAGFERECNEEMRRVSGRAPQGVFVPSLALAGRALLTTANAGSMIGTDHMGSEFIDALRPEIQVMNLGARVLPGLRENVSIPRMPAGTQAEWIAEDAEAVESTPSFDSVTLTLKQLSARTRISRRQAKQSLPGLDAVLSNDMRRQIAVAVDRAAIDGAGSATEPLGILRTPGIGSVAIGVNGGNLDWPTVTDLMAAVEAANVPMGSVGFLSNHKVKSAMLSTAKLPAGGDTAILTTTPDGAFIAGNRAAFTSLVPSDFTKGTGVGLSALIFGVWSDLLIGQWGGIDLLVDDMTESHKGNVRITAHSEWDIAVRNPESFAVINDIDTTRA